MKTKSILVMVTILSLITIRTMGATYFDDGLIHNVDYSEAHVYVDSGATGMKTTVNLLNREKRSNCGSRTNAASDKKDA